MPPVIGPVQTPIDQTPPPSDTPDWERPLKRAIESLQTRARMHDLTVGYAPTTAASRSGGTIYRFFATDEAGNEYALTQMTQYPGMTTDFRGTEEWEQELTPNFMELVTSSGGNPSRLDGLKWLHSACQQMKSEVKLPEGVAMTNLSISSRSVSDSPRLKIHLTLPSDREWIIEGEIGLPRTAESAMSIVKEKTELGLQHGYLKKLDLLRAQIKEWEAMGLKVELDHPIESLRLTGLITGEGISIMADTAYVPPQTRSYSSENPLATIRKELARDAGVRLERQLHLLGRSDLKVEEWTYSSTPAFFLTFPGQTRGTKTCYINMCKENGAWKTADELFKQLKVLVNPVNTWNEVAQCLKEKLSERVTKVAINPNKETYGVTPPEMVLGIQFATMPDGVEWVEIKGNLSGEAIRTDLPSVDQLAEGLMQQIEEPAAICEAWPQFKTDITEQVASRGGELTSLGLDTDRGVMRTHNSIKGTIRIADGEEANFYAKIKDPEFRVNEPTSQNHYLTPQQIESACRKEIEAKMATTQFKGWAKECSDQWQKRNCELQLEWRGSSRVMLAVKRIHNTDFRVSFDVYSRNSTISTQKDDGTLYTKSQFQKKINEAAVKAISNKLLGFQAFADVVKTANAQLKGLGYTTEEEAIEYTISPSLGTLSGILIMKPGALPSVTSDLCLVDDWKRVKKKERLLGTIERWVKKDLEIDHLSSWDNIAENYPDPKMTPEGVRNQILSHEDHEALVADVERRLQAPLGTPEVTVFQNKRLVNYTDHDFAFKTTKTGNYADEMFIDNCPTDLDFDRVPQELILFNRRFDGLGVVAKDLGVDGIQGFTLEKKGDYWKVDRPYDFC